MMKRVIAPRLSATSRLSDSKPNMASVPGGHRAASKSARPSARSRAPAAVEVAGTWTASGMCARIHRRHWAQAWGCVAMRRMSPSPVPGRTARQKTMGTSISALISRGLPAVRLSSVALTPPSTEFSMGTTA